MTIRFLPRVLLSMLLVLVATSTTAEEQAKKSNQTTASMYQLLEELETHPCALDTDGDGVVDCSDDSPKGTLYLQQAAFAEETKQTPNNGFFGILLTLYESTE